MQTITVKINKSSVLKTLKDLESRHLISIVKDTDFETPSLSGNSLSLAQFRNWVKDAESATTVSLNDVNEKWANRRKQLKGLMK